MPPREVPIPKPRPPAGDTWHDGFRFAMRLACAAVCPYCDRDGIPDVVGSELHCWHDFEDAASRLCKASAILHAAHFRVALDGPA